MSTYKVVEIYTDQIELQQFLKLADLIQSGGEAKSFLQSNEIKCNGELENRRKHKLKDNDVVVVNGNEYRIKKT